MKQRILIKKSSIWVILLLFSIYVFPLYIRYGFIPQKYAGPNFLGAIALICLSLKYIKKKNKVFSIPFFAWAVMLVVALYVQIIRSVTLSNNLMVFVNFFIPALPFAFDMEFDLDAANYIRRGTNIVCAIQLSAYVYKLLTGTSLSYVLGVLIKSSPLVSLATRPIAEKRFCSWMGHELSICAIFLIGFVLEIIYRRTQNNEAPPYYYALLYGFGVAITASKSGLLIYVAMFSIVYLSNIKYIIGAIVTATIVLYSGVLDFVFSRFSEGSLSTNRLETLQYVIKNHIVDFSIINGKGSQALVYLSSVSRGATSFTAGFEFPILIYALEYGIVFAIIASIYLFFKPLYSIWKVSKDGIVLLTTIFMVVYLNGYNALGLYHDEMYWYIIAIVAINSYLRSSKKGNANDERGK